MAYVRAIVRGAADVDHRIVRNPIRPRGLFRVR
jgi:hypothetical protein